MTLEILSSVRVCLEHTPATVEGIEKLAMCLGYQTLQSKEQLLDPDTLFQQKDIRNRIVGLRKILSMQGTWKHPASRQIFTREAAIFVIEVDDESTLRSRWPFEITRYAVKFGLLGTQAIFFFVTQKSRTFVATAYEIVDGTDKVQVRRLVVDLDNIARTDVEALAGLTFQFMSPETIVERFRKALPYLKVGTEFFKQYQQLFQALAKRLTGALDSQKESYGYAQRLLGRITFLFFLQRKGWLDGDRAYMKRGSQLEGHKLFDFMYELFGALNAEAPATSHRLGKIPYLNGSLFEPEEYSQNKMKRISQACAPLLTDILNTFTQYNFTISESTPLNKEVAVDPELLGSLFESMLPETERGAKGTFYTHQDEMLFMAKEAIHSFLRRFSSLLTDDQVLHLAYGLDQTTFPKIEPRVAREVKENLKAIKILDPAVGSGGFLMAGLQGLLDTRARLNGIIGTTETDYDMKLEIIENNLFGVDIEQEAIELARLRLWLSLVVDEPFENVRPLPNLDFYLLGGDSLKIPDFEKAREIKLTVDDTIRTALLKEISTVREEYSRSHGKEKERKRAELTNALGKLVEVETGTRPDKSIPFSFRYLFADVIASGGFDVILMNPPYITQEEIGKLPGQNPRKYKSDIIADIQTLTNDSFVPNKRSDIAVYFLVRTITLLKEGGVSVVIATNKWLDTGYGVPLQEYLLKHVYLDYVLDCVDKSFSAEVNTAITVIRKPSDSDGVSANLTRFVYLNVNYKAIDGNLMKEILTLTSEGTEFRKNFRVTSYTQGNLHKQGLTTAEEDDESVEGSTNEKLAEGSSSKMMYIGTKWGNLHLHSPPVYHKLLDRGRGKLGSLGDYYKIIRGPVTGANDFFILEEVEEKERLKGLVRCQNGFGLKFHLEREFCPHVLMKPEDDAPYEIKQNQLKLRIFNCHKDRRSLRDTYALRYIEWAEKSTEAKITITQGADKGRTVRIPELSTVRSRAEWYQIPSASPAKILCPQGIKNKQIVFLAKDTINFECRFYGLYAKDDSLDVWLYLNSAVFRMFLEMNGRTEGAGALSVKVYEYKQCPVLSPMPPIASKFKGLEAFRSRQSYRIVNMAEEGQTEFELADRKELDDLVLQDLGFDDPKERQETLRDIYSWLIARTRERLSKAKTGPESVTRGVDTEGNQADLRLFA